MLPAEIAPPDSVIDPPVLMRIVFGTESVFVPEMPGEAPSGPLESMTSVALVIASVPPVQLNRLGLLLVLRDPTERAPLERLMLLLPLFQSLSVPVSVTSPPATFSTPVPPSVVVLPPR